jgi:hypothetical protein
MQMQGKKEKASSTVKDDKALRKTPIHCAFGIPSNSSVLAVLRRPGKCMF